MAQFMNDSGYSSRFDRRGTSPTAPRCGLLTLEDAVAVLSCHRLEVLTTLASTGMFGLSALARQLALERSALSHQMERLVHAGVVDFSRTKTAHDYQLSSRVSRFVEDGMVQLSLTTRNGDWLLLHHYFDSDNGRVVLPPSKFLDAHR